METAYPGWEKVPSCFFWIWMTELWAAIRDGKKMTGGTVTAFSPVEEGGGRVGYG